MLIPRTIKKIKVLKLNILNNILTFPIHLLIFTIFYWRYIKRHFLNLHYYINLIFNQYSPNLINSEFIFSGKSSPFSSFRFKSLGISSSK